MTDIIATTVVVLPHPGGPERQETLSSKWGLTQRSDRPSCDSFMFSTIASKPVSDAPRSLQQALIRVVLFIAILVKYVCRKSLQTRVGTDREATPLVSERVEG
jgi:hypothetical protein